jgi:hypothetical protein
VARASELARRYARDPLIFSATNSTASDHKSQIAAHSQTAQSFVVPNVAIAML